MSRSLFALPLLLAGCLAVAQEPPPSAAPATPVAAPGPVTYALSGSLLAKVYKDPSTMAAGLSHDHVVQATAWRGTAAWDPANLSTCKVDIKFPVTSLMPDDPALRKQMGFTSELSESDRATVRSHIQGADQLNATAFPTIQFASTACAAAGSKVNVTGTFTLHGVGKSITAPMTVTADGTSFSAKGGFSFNQSDYGFQPFTAMMGQLKNMNKVDVLINVTGKKQ